jgi:hypothetical protein
MVTACQQEGRPCGYVDVQLGAENGDARQAHVTVLEREGAD